MNTKDTTDKLGTPPSNIVSFTRSLDDDISNIIDNLKEEQFNPQSIQEDLTENPVMYPYVKDEAGKKWPVWSEDPPKDKTVVLPLSTDKTNPNQHLLDERKNNPNWEKNLKETKKVMTNFREKVATYPKHISHEGSTVLCVLLSIEPNPSIRMDGLPAIDKEVIRQMLPETLVNKIFDDIRVSFDEQKDFIVTFYDGDDVVHTVRLFNTVIHPPNSPTPTSVVEVEDGDKISIGGRVVMDKNSVKKLIGFKPELAPKKEEEKEEPRRQVSGRNAFEIRTDIMQMALDWAKSNGKSNMSPDEIITVAKKFYSFVENKRY
jgi:hypothetical protein